MARTLKAGIYFAYPYSAWECGTNENTNGLMRQSFAKGKSLLNVSRQSLQLGMDRLNHLAYPR